MLKSTTARLAAAGALAFAALGTVGTTTASALPAWNWCQEGGLKGVCATVSATTLWTPQGNIYAQLRSGTTVNVQCWYTGGPGDGYWDHVTWTSQTQSVQGHVADDAVNLGGHTPPQLGLPRCG